MINYNKNKLINECLVKYYETFAHTLDTADYVPEKFNKKILAYIFRNMKRQFRKVDREDKRKQRELLKKAKAKAKQKQLEVKENDKEIQQIPDAQESVENAESPEKEKGNSAE